MAPVVVLSGSRAPLAARRRRPLATALLVALALLALAAPAAASHGRLRGVQAPYRGQVLDAATGRPLEGVLVIALWSYVDPARPAPVDFAWREAVTDARGAFALEAAAIERAAPPRALEPELFFFFPGYRPWPPHTPARHGAPAGTFTGGGAVVRLQPAASPFDRLEALADFLDMLEKRTFESPRLAAVAAAELAWAGGVDWAALAARDPESAPPDPCRRGSAAAPSPGTGARSSTRRGGIYRGRVVDAETGQPLPGAAVVAVWMRDVVRPVHSTTYFYAACEALTDDRGAFAIDARPVEDGAPRTVRGPDFQVFLPGYAAAQSGGRDPGSGRTTYRLARLPTVEERRRALLHVAVSVPPAKVPNLVRLINQERTSLGLEPVHPAGGR